MPPLQPYHHLVTLLLLLILPCGSMADTTGAGGSDDHGQFVYNGFAGANVTLDGAATVTPNGLLMLTNGNGSIQMMGHALHPSPLPFHNATSSFSTTFVFAIFGQYEDLSASGLAFVVAGDRAVLSTAMPGQFLGLLNGSDDGNRSTHVFAVEFDTLFNAEIRDMNSNHVGVDVDSLVSRAAENAGYYDDATGQFRNLTLISRKPMQAWVDYDGNATEVTVTMAPMGLPRPKKPLLQTTVDLSDVVSRDTAYVGFSSATGMLFSRHFVVGWSFSLHGPAPELDISELPKLPRVGPKPRSKVAEIVVPISSATLVLAVGITVYAMARCRSKYAELREDWELPFGAHRFAYRDLFRATSGFSDRHLLGAGGFGRVYKGVLIRNIDDDMDVAVKRVSKQGTMEFVAEVASLGRLRHRNLVQLLGYCRRRGELLLVYDYMPNGSLDKYLYECDGTNKDTTLLNWPRRLHIIRGVASALLYLHEDWEQVVVHRDVKASNVLLDGEMNARLGDFGLARLYDHGADAYTTHVMGTMGYLAPELGHTGKATPATDVFAFGAFLLEVTCGRRPVEQDEQNNCTMLVDRVIEHLRNGSIVHVVDWRIQQGGYNPQEVSLVLKLGLLCSHPLPSGRPTMRQVIQYLDGNILLPELSQTYFSFTEMYHMNYYLHQDTSRQSYMSSTSSMGSISDLSGGR